MHQWTSMARVPRKVTFTLAGQASSVLKNNQCRNLGATLSVTSILRSVYIYI